MRGAVRVLYVGGPAAGRREFVEEGRTHLHVAVHPPMPAYSAPGGGPVDAAYAVHTYRVEHLVFGRLGPGTSTYPIAVPVGWSVGRAVEELLRGYGRAL